MEQQINLYLPEFRVKKDQITVLRMSQVLGVVLLLMVLVSSVDLIRRWQSNAELESLQQMLVAATQETDQVEGELARRSQNDELSNRLELAERRLESSRQIKDFLSDSTLGNVVGFSEYIKDLSRASIDGLSITNFKFSEGGRRVELSGEVADSALVPRYVANIENGQSPLKEQHFSPSISRSNVENSFFTFILSNGQ